MTAGMIAERHLFGGAALLAVGILIWIAFQGYDAVGVVPQLQAAPFCGG